MVSQVEGGLREKKMLRALMILLPDLGAAHRQMELLQNPDAAVADGQEAHEEEAAARRERPGEVEPPVGVGDEGVEGEIRAAGLKASEPRRVVVTRGPFRGLVEVVVRGGCGGGGAVGGLEEGAEEDGGAAGVVPPEPDAAEEGPLRGHAAPPLAGGRAAEEALDAAGRDQAGQDFAEAVVRDLAAGARAHSTGHLSASEQGSICLCGFVGAGGW
ncbi:hypothetical protein BRADI_5g21662v3 [Brachypodium distachyon]|uniref:Uncharacterized protein n=1 Tax=Brachypodium distachyon TaxID=15368 RepID=A0A0Q3H8M9_BRADI|nr:hypothetical protein BRADI_5g21662v3 [Brachypodium distachyon]